MGISVSFSRMGRFQTGSGVYTYFGQPLSTNNRYSPSFSATPCGIKKYSPTLDAFTTRHAYNRKHYFYLPFFFMRHPHIFVAGIALSLVVGASAFADTSTGATVSASGSTVVSSGATGATVTGAVSTGTTATGAAATGSTATGVVSTGATATGTASTGATATGVVSTGATVTGAIVSTGVVSTGAVASSGSSSTGVVNGPLARYTAQLNLLLQERAAKIQAINAQFNVKKARLLLRLRAALRLQQAEKNLKAAESNLRQLEPKKAITKSGAVAPIVSVSQTGVTVSQSGSTITVSQTGVVVPMTASGAAR